MKPVSPVIPDKNVPEGTFSGTGHSDLPHIVDNEGGATSRWVFEPGELEQIVKQGFIYVRQLGAVNSVQPIHISAYSPIRVEGASAVDDDPALNADEIGTT